MIQGIGLAQILVDGGTVTVVRHIVPRCQVGDVTYFQMEASLQTGVNRRKEK
ncbi:hypothetical protein T458_13375 [Brevibacillus panacihumi W25]|uniref:Uncharacterized protein n=1 Tax=Brevibacillus panacihumi W25 TaxID=1408254 RepID=V6M7R8_9BACL|nr:hypothetical protein T458_13375 [Brevibacillus panacihumi W25]